eukprot:749369-Hanusia_phi.AAC.6
MELRERERGGRGRGGGGERERRGRGRGGGRARERGGGLGVTRMWQAEITSHDVARVVRSLAGPDFLKVTGAQLPVNGGDERTV